jgi:hypothetical protein
MKKDKRIVRIAEEIEYLLTRTCEDRATARAVLQFADALVSATWPFPEVDELLSPRPKASSKGK